MLCKLSSLFLVLGISVGYRTTITEQVQPYQTATDSQIGVTQLPDRALKPGTPAEYATIAATYKSLSRAELGLFNTLRMESENKCGLQKLVNNGVCVSQAQLTTFTQVLQQVYSLRIEINKPSLVYGLAYNKLG